MKDLSLEISLNSLKNWYQEHDAPQNNRKEEDEKILKGPCGLWGWIPFVKNLKKKKH